MERYTITFQVTSHADPSSILDAATEHLIDLTDTGYNESIQVDEDTISVCEAKEQG